MTDILNQTIVLLSFKGKYTSVSERGHCKEMQLKKMHVCMLSPVQLFVTPWTTACQAPLSIGFFRQGNWSRLPFPPPGNLPTPGIQLRSPVSLLGRPILNHWALWEAPIKKKIHTHTHTSVFDKELHYEWIDKWVVCFENHVTSSVEVSMNSKEGVLPPLCFNIVPKHGSIVECLPLMYMNLDLSPKWNYKILGYRILI